MLENLPNLAFLPVSCLLIHEWHDDQRTPPLIERIKASGVFRNPPIVAPLNDGTGRYMVLDGANRITALRKMGYPDALVQVFEPDDPGLILQNWNHVVWGLDPLEFFRNIREIPDINLIPTVEGDYPDLWGRCGLAIVQLPKGSSFTICTPAGELVTRVKHLNDIVNSYKDRCSLDRTNVTEIAQLVDIYPDLSGLFIFPHFDVEHVMKLAGAGFLLPAGITRFTCSPRALHLNYPLRELASQDPVEVKNARLHQWISERIAKKGVRYYAEATFLFDE